MRPLLDGRVEATIVLKVLCGAEFIGRGLSFETESGEEARLLLHGYLEKDILWKSVGGRGIVSNRSSIDCRVSERNVACDPPFGTGIILQIEESIFHDCLLTIIISRDRVFSVLPCDCAVVRTLSSSLEKGY
jgi:hypothetical protein